MLAYATPSDSNNDQYIFRMSQSSFIPSRREFLTICGGVGVVSSFFVGALYALAAASPSEPISAEIIDQAAELAGITILPEQKQAMLSQLRDQRNSIVKIELNHTIVPAHDKEQSARFYEKIFGFKQEEPLGHFAPVALRVSR